MKSTGTAGLYIFLAMHTAPVVQIVLSRIVIGHLDMCGNSMATCVYSMMRMFKIYINVQVQVSSFKVGLTKRH